MEGKRSDLELAKAFFKKSKDDLESADILLKNKKYADAIYHSQQSVEKVIKALLILEGKFVESHFVADIAKDIIDKDSYEYAKSLEKNWIISRYPFKRKFEVWNPVEGFTKSDASEALKKAKFVFNKISKILDKMGVKDED